MIQVKDIRISIVRGVIEFEVVTDTTHTFAISASDAARVGLQLLAAAKKLVKPDKGG